MIQPFQKLVTPNREINMIQDNIVKTLNPIAALATNSGQILTKVSLVSGSNSINHLLGRNLVGWFIVRQRASATIYDTQDSNNTPSLTLQLVASAGVSVDIFVF